MRVTCPAYPIFLGKLKLNETHQFLVSTDDVNLLEDNINTIKRNIEALIDVRKEVGLEASRENEVCHQNAGKNHNMANRSFQGSFIVK
jgi:hypothetical protein